MSAFGNENQVIDGLSGGKPLGDLDDSGHPTSSRNTFPSGTPERGHVVTYHHPILARGPLEHVAVGGA